MPTLITFAACRKVIIEEEQKTASLVELLDVIKIAVPSGTNVPGQAIIPLDWYVYSWWRSDPEDAGQKFQQRITLFAPDGEETLTAVNDFSFEAEKHRFKLAVTAFPVSMPGTYWLRLSLRKAGQDWIEVASYPIGLAHEYSA